MEEQKNQSIISVLFLQGFSVDPKMQIPLFVLFFLIYLLTLTGNLLIFTVIIMDHRLHTPMYFFLCNLSFLDLSYASIIQPKLLSIIVMENHAISFEGCIVQLYLFLCLAVSEFFFLAAMAYDRYIAICKPLKYSVLMNFRVCVQIATTCWISCFLEPLTHLIILTQLPLCNQLINHFFCDYSAFLKLSCNDTFFIEIMTNMFGSVLGFPVILITLASYVYIFSTIRKLHSRESKHKAFSTCVPHLTVVTLFYSTILIMAMRPSSQYSPFQNKISALLYTVLIPVVNPFIYTLRNKDVKQSFHKIFRKRSNR